MWKQSEHLVLIGQTGSGKTTIAQKALEMRTNRGGSVLALITKTDDLLWSGYRTIKRASQADIRRTRRFRLFPTIERQQYEFASAFRQAWDEGGWTVYVDEAYYIENYLKLRQELLRLLTQGRSKQITVVLGVQRPAWISRFIMSEPTHILCGRLGDNRDMKVVSEILGNDQIGQLSRLERYQFLYYNKATGQSRIVGGTNKKDEVLDVLH